MTANKKRKTERRGDSRIALIIATNIEAQPFIDALRLTLFAMDTPCPLFKRGGLLLAVSGVGKANAAIATTYVCATFRPSLILNLGAAGSTGPQCGLGSIFHIVSVCEPDRPQFSSGKPFLHLPQLLPGFDTARLATQDRAMITGPDREMVSEHAELVDMEGAAIVQAARRFGVPVVLFKFVSDTPERNDIRETLAYMKDQSTVFCRFIVDEVMPLLEGREPGPATSKKE